MVGEEHLNPARGAVNKNQILKLVSTLLINALVEVAKPGILVYRNLHTIKVTDFLVNRLSLCQIPYKSLSIQIALLIE